MGWLPGCIAWGVWGAGLCPIGQQQQFWGIKGPFCNELRLPGARFSFKISFKNIT
jgi:hypothetical protein